MVSASASKEADHFVKQIGCQQRGNFAVVTGRRDLYQIASDKLLPFQTTHQVENLGAGESAHLGSSSTRRKSRINDIYVQREVDPLAAEFLQNPRNGSGARAMQFLRADHMEAVLTAECEIIFGINLAAQTRL